MNLCKTKKICLWLLISLFLSGINYNVFAIPKKSKTPIKKVTVKKTEKKIAYSFLNPAPIGTTQKILIKNSTSSENEEITVKSVFRGKQAWDMVKQSDAIYDQEPPLGYEYILVKIKFKLLTEKNKNPNCIYAEPSLEGVLVSSKKKDYVLNSYIYQPAEKEIWASYLVKKDDLQPRLVFGRDNKGKGGIWFKAYLVTSKDSKLKK